ncbi:MAG: glycosyltransferase [Dehalococcoidia bacterium]|nr:MAG: glycosyltransferase [Dehalococcoidia bacterium]
MPERIKILGVPLDLVDMKGALVTADNLINGSANSNCVLAVNPEKIIALHQDEWLLDFFRKAALLIPDGIGAVWAARTLSGAKVGRVPGADLMQNLCALAAKKGYKVFFYGAKEEVSAGAVDILEQRYPGLEVVGRRNGFVQPTEMDALVNQINASGAQILFIALGSPRQEKWVAQYGVRLQVKLIQGIGGTLDTITGHVKRAPEFWQRFNLEWFYRLINEPKRITRQIKLPVFSLMVIKQKFFSR